MTADRIFLFAMAVGVAGFVCGVWCERVRVRAIARLRDLRARAADAETDREARRLAAAFVLECAQRGLDIKRVAFDATIITTTDTRSTP